MRIMHNKMICGHADYAGTNQLTQEVTDEHGHISYVAVVLEHGDKQGRTYMVSTKDGDLVLDDDGLSCLMSTLKHLSTCEIKSM